MKDVGKSMVSLLLDDFVYVVDDKQLVDRIDCSMRWLVF